MISSGFHLLEGSDIIRPLQTHNILTFKHNAGRKQKRRKKGREERGEGEKRVGERV
jgi:hypothetical protein